MNAHQRRIKRRKERKSIEDQSWSPVSAKGDWWVALDSQWVPIKEDGEGNFVVTATGTYTAGSK